METKITNKYLNTEIFSGIALLSAAILAIVLANSPYKNYYEYFINYHFGFCIGETHFNKSILFWINDGLISLFFFLIGLEIKREIFSGQLSEKGQMVLPCSAAIAGMIFPALIYTFFNYENPVNMRGWAIPIAMDTAFSLGILSLLGNTVPKSLKIFLMSLAIIDDILAVLVIAVFYAEELSPLSVIASASILGILALLNQIKVNRMFPYLLLGLALWMFVLQSGVHTSIAGVLLAFTIPINNNENKNLLGKIESAIHPWVSFGIIPLFAFANAGISLESFSFEKLLNPLSMGIILGLFIGKQLGVFSISWILEKFGVVKLPIGASWVHMYGASLLCGIGFTMSLFIGALSFENGGPQYNDLVKLSVYVGSFLSAIAALIVFNLKRFKFRKAIGNR